MGKLLILLFLIPIFIFSQDAGNFEGKIGDNKIEMFLYLDYTNRKVYGIYKYEKYNNIIDIDGKFESPLEIIEYKNKKPFAKLIFPHFNEMNNPNIGTWKKLNDNIEFPIEITNTDDIFCSDNACFYDKVEILQKQSTIKYFFKLELEKIEGSLNPIVTAIKIYSKKNGKLNQKISMVSPYNGIYSIEIGDYNFDGKTDFSIYKNRYSKKYFLFEKNKFVESNFRISNSEFNTKSKEVKEERVLYSGKWKTINFYKVIQNKLKFDRQLFYKLLNNNYIKTTKEEFEKFEEDFEKCPDCF